MIQYLLKHSKEDFIQTHYDKWKDYCSGGFAVDNKNGLSCEYSKGKWEFIAKEQVMDQWVEITKGNILDVKERRDFI